MVDKDFIVKGHFCFSEGPRKLVVKENHYLVCEEGRIKGIFPQIPDQNKGMACLDYGDRLIIPGLTDLHLHGPQYVFRGIGMDQELLDWLNTWTFPEEAKYREIEYAKRAYRLFAQDLRQSATCRAVVFGTIHREATEYLMEELEAAGITAYVGKVNMDRNCPENYREETKASIEDTEMWIQNTAEKFTRVKPILTPRFIPACSDGLMEGLGRLQEKYHLPVQSHLSENKSEVQWVKELCPWAECYGAAYDRFGLFGSGGPAVMAHCVYSEENELALMKKNGTYIAHCPQSNTNLASGIAPVRRFLEMGIPTGLGTDVAGSHSSSVFRTMVEAVQVSKLRWRLAEDTLKPLTIEEAFYLGTAGGGSFFGKAGSFEEGSEAEFLVLDESRIPYMKELSVARRLERYLYLCGEKDLLHKFSGGRMIF